MEYFGALDKPISQIVISNSYEGAERYRNAMMEKEPWYEWQQAHLHLLNLPRLGRLVSTVESDKDGVQQEPDLQHPYNGVSATIITPLGRNTFFFHIEPAMPLLHQLENLCKDDKSLRSDLLYFENEVRRLG